MMRKVLYSVFLLVVGWIIGISSFGFLFGPAIQEENERRIVFSQLEALDEIRTESISLYSSSETDEFTSSLLSAICMKISSLKSEANKIDGQSTNPLNIAYYAELVQEGYGELFDSLKLSSGTCINRKRALTP
jgi:regulator of RNase E activity RraB